ncbi:GntR family transcriptional regulator [Herbiconiux sp. UC225_62]|uniref:GntR family transcriptional regulator n=1 Tax=Herbiconiux sp. UC225_62 TaxID=3350168 RepID=UPI0036D4312A
MTDPSEVLRRGVLAIAREVSTTGGALPGEHELARRLDANRPQVRRVLAQLEQQGIVRRHQGAATTVDPIALQMTVRLEEQLEHRELLDRLGYEPGVELLGQERIELASPLTEVLGAPALSPAIRARKRWTADGRPAMLAENVLLLPGSTDEHGTPGVPVGDDPIDAGRSIFALVEELWREPVVWEVATPGVENVAEPHATLLGLEPGAACMTFTIVGVLRSGRRVFHAFERHNPAIVQYSVVRRFPEPWT